MDDPVETVVATVQREFPNTDIIDVSAAPAGTRATYLVECSDRNVAVTLCREPADEQQFVLEPQVIRLVERKTTLPVPELLAVDCSKMSIPYMYYVTQAVDGYNPRRRYKYLPQSVREDILVQTGQYLGELHTRIGFDTVGTLCATDESRGIAIEPADSWPTFLRSLMDGWTSTLDGGRFDDLIPTFETVAADCATYVDEKIDPVLLHFDYRPANLIVKDGEIATILDWELARAGHNEYDFFKFEKNFLLAHFETPSIRDDLREFVYRGYRTVLGLEPGWKRRRAYYRVAYKLESMASFPRWTRNLGDHERNSMETKLRDELETDLRRLRNETY